MVFAALLKSCPDTFPIAERSFLTSYSDVKKGEREFNKASEKLLSISETP